MDDAYSCDYSSRVSLAIVESVCGKAREFKEGAARIADLGYSLSWEHFVSSTVALDVFATATLFDGCKAPLEFGAPSEVMFASALPIRA